MADNQKQEEIKDALKVARFYRSMHSNALNSFTDEKISSRMIHKRSEKIEEHQKKITEYDQQIEKLEQELKQLQ